MLNSVMRYEDFELLYQPTIGEKMGNLPGSNQAMQQMPCAGLLLGLEREQK